MGEVYRARDTKLRREVALKVLPETFAADPDRRARFTRESHVLASLNHPNIAAIHGLEESEGITALVLELVEGPTLAERLRDASRLGPEGAGLPVDDALKIAVQIADALEAAHEKGIVHRDLKPANIKLTPDERVKVLDFGLAKALGPAEGGQGEGARSFDVDAPSSPTMTAMASRLGMIIGTAAYMSPEQAKGKAVDKRADIWAFGCVLYEMLAGRRAFDGEDVTDMLVATMTKEPDWSTLPPSTPPRIVELLRRCLKKDPRERLRDIGDARMEIDEAMREPSPSPAPTTAPERVWRKALVPWTIAGLMTLVGVIAVGSRRTHEPGAIQAAARLAVVVPDGDQLWLGAEYGDSPALAISPDGSRLVYVASHGGTTRLYVRRLSEFTASPIAGTEGGFAPFFSPDGQSVGFFTERELRKVSLSGGSPTTVCQVSPVTRGGAWGSDDTIFFVDGSASGIRQVAATGGNTKVVTTVDLERGERSQRWPEVLPGGQAVLYTLETSGEGQGDGTHVVVHSLKTGESRIVIRGASSARYVASGHVIYASRGSLLAAPFDVTRLVVTGAPVPVLNGVRVGALDAAQFAVSQAGLLAYVPGGAEKEQRSLVWVDRRGHEQTLPIPPRPYSSPVLSPDGQRLALLIRPGSTSDIWTYDVTRGSLGRLTFRVAESPVWTPDGRRITFSSRVPLTREYQEQQNFPWDYRLSLFSQDADGNGTPKELLLRMGVQFPGSWTPDGRVLAYVDGDFTGNRLDIWLLTVGEDSKSTPFLNTPFDEIQPVFSPDGRWIAYVSNESGRHEVYVRPFPGPAGGRSLISIDGGVEPRWRRDGRELFYRSGDKMMAVAVATTAAFRAEAPHLLFEGRHLQGGTRPGFPQYDVTPDGQRFVMITEPERVAPPTRLHVVLNWQSP
jgi:serine/threonine-protein kinase